MPSRCDSGDSFHLLTSDSHPRLLHAVALRLKGGRHQVVGGTCAKSSSCSCSECQPRPLISDLQPQFPAEKSPRLRLNCEATAGVPPMSFPWADAHGYILSPLRG
jgi:hypothetical protein